MMALTSGPPAGLFFPTPAVPGIVPALAFLALVGATSIAESSEAEIPSGYLHPAMAFCAVIERVDIRLRRRAAAVADKILGCCR